MSSATQLLNARSSALEILPLSAVAGAEVRGVQLSGRVEGELKQDILDAFLAHHVLVFRDQDVSKEAQLEFTQSFGELEGHVIRLSDGKPAPLLHVISNLDGEGRPSSKPWTHGNYYWHTDKSYHAVPSLMTLLHAKELPPAGGDTQYANTALAYDALDDARKREIANLRVVHSWEANRKNTGNRPATEDEKRDRPPVTHPLVRTHPDSGRKTLYMGIHTSHIDGLAETQGQALLKELLEVATQPRFIYSHQWRPGDFVMWDNRCLLHRATDDYDMNLHRRVLHRTVVKGSVPF